jgi:hypothetical protein
MILTYGMHAGAPRMVSRTPIGRRVRPYSPQASRGRSGACVLAAALNLSRHPAAVLTSLPAPCAFADLDGVLARVLRSPRADRRAGSPARRAAGSRAARASGTAARARRPGPSYPRYLQPGPDGPASVAAGGRSPVTSEGSWPFRCFGYHVGASDGGVDDGIELVYPASTLLHSG